MPNAAPAAFGTSLTVQPRLIVKRLLVTTFVLLLLNLMSVYYQRTTPHSVAGALISQYFNFSSESNIPTFFSALLLLTAASLLAVLAFQHRRTPQASYWWGLAGIFLFLAVDESAQIHEGVTQLMYLVTTRVQLPGYFLYAWVMPYSVAVVGVGLFFFNFLLKLPLLTRGLFVAAGALFVTGALGLEMLEGHFTAVYGEGNLYTTLLITLEELLEMSGVILFIHALLRCLCPTSGKISLLLSE